MRPPAAFVAFFPLFLLSAPRPKAACSRLDYIRRLSSLVCLMPCAFFICLTFFLMFFSPGSKRNLPSYPSFVTLYCLKKSASFPMKEYRKRLPSGLKRTFSSSFSSYGDFFFIGRNRFLFFFFFFLTGGFLKMLCFLDTMKELGSCI